MSQSRWAEIELPENVLASTRVRYNVLTGENIDIDIAFNDVPRFSSQNTNFFWSATGSGTDGKLDVQNVAAHEIGHFTGLKDLYNPGDPAYALGIGMGAHNEDQTLYGRININELKKRTLYDDGNSPRVEGDIAGIEAIYNAVDNSLADIVLVFDGSANFVSENVYNGFTPSKNSALELVNKLRDGDRIAIVNSNTTNYSLSGFTKEGAISFLQGMQPGGNGNLAQRLTQAQAELDMNGITERQKIIVLFSAGEEFSSPSILDAGYGLPTYPVSTFGFQSSSFGQNKMGWLANQTDGEYYEINNSTEIPNVVNVIWYRLLGMQVTYLSDPISSTDIKMLW